MHNIIHIKILYIGVKFTQICIKLGELMCQFCARYSNIYILYTCESETIRNQLISYLTLHIGNWKFGNSQSINRLFGKTAQ